MIRDSNVESYQIYKDMYFLEVNVPTSFNNNFRFVQDSTGNITNTFNRLAEALVKDTTINSYMILNTTIENTVDENVSDEAIDE